MQAQVISPYAARCGTSPRRTWCVVLLALLMAWCTTLAVPRVAQAEVPSFVTVKKGRAANLASKLTAKEKLAYKRAYQACLNYQNLPKTITVDVSDLGLTNAQALHVGYLLHSNGELFWVSTYNDDNFNKDRFILPCVYEDAAINAMRDRLDKKVKKVLKRFGTGMSSVNKVQTLHDYLCENVTYGDHYKTAYDALVLGHADCFGYTQAMDLLLRRAGFSTDMAYNLEGTHSWNLVRMSGTWYHIDVTWDSSYSHKYFWQKQNCYLFFLQSDKAMKNDGYTPNGHGRWWSQHTCGSKKYHKNGDTSFVANHNVYKLYSNGFKVAGLKYKLVSSKKCVLAKVTASAKRRSKTITLPARVTYKGKTYKVVGIASGALGSAKAKTLVVESGALASARVKGSLEGCKVKKVRLAGAAKAKRSKYKKYFAETSCGRKVKVV